VVADREGREPPRENHPLPRDRHASPQPNECGPTASFLITEEILKTISKDGAKQSDAKDAAAKSK
jgi:hypothetical protein